MDFTRPECVTALLAEMDAFIEAEAKPLEREHVQYFDRRREHSRTDWDNDGISAREWEELLPEMRGRAGEAGWLRYGLSAAVGGRGGTHLDMAVIRDHRAHQAVISTSDQSRHCSSVPKRSITITCGKFPTVEDSFCKSLCRPISGPAGWSATPPTVPCRSSGLGYGRHEPFGHIYRCRHRRCRVTEGAEEIQIRRVAQRLIKFGKT